MEYREITTQAELDALPPDVVAVVRSGFFRASGSATVQAWGSATVQARDSATVQASKFVAIHSHPRYGRTPNITGGVVIHVPDLERCDAATWLDFHDLAPAAGEAVVYKAVDDNWQANYGAAFTYAPGVEVVAPDYDSGRACGQGLHFGATPRQARKYRPEATRFVACAVPVDSIVPLGDKIKARSCRVLFEVDIDGTRVTA